MKKKLLVTVLSFALITAQPACGPISLAEEESIEEPIKVTTVEEGAAAGADGSGPADAVELHPGVYHDELTKETKWYRLEVDSGESLHLIFRAGEGKEKFTVKLLNPDHDLVWGHEGLAHNQSRTFTLEAEELAEFESLTFYLVVAGDNGGYTLTFNSPK